MRPVTLQLGACGILERHEKMHRPLGNRAMAMSSSYQPQAHFLARELLKPPVTPLSDLFSWVEQEQEALKQRYAANPLAIDIALESFLELLVEFRTILLQVMAILYHKFPQSRVFSFSPFNPQIFRDFASQAFSQVEEAEKATLENLKRLPQQMEDSIRGILVTTIESKRISHSARTSH
ncbi:hypothetical protein M422DRAFT_47846 [Sphaerobolus stellatus SS14]|uniref:Ndc10 domain-containing protein n=1 Tax=Sphaerobolus stellatus (strain SS14) TaxID=990650 RepID=A0A0C9VXK4_SPHS4|nr:hypothetical protein M422DRAFT_47846 [Sphaerobolus stellatus SS14]